MKNLFKNIEFKNVKIVGYKINPFPYLKLANLFVLTSKFEGLPNVLLEAAVFKKLLFPLIVQQDQKKSYKRVKMVFYLKLEIIEI